MANLDTQLPVNQEKSIDNTQQQVQQQQPQTQQTQQQQPQKPQQMDVETNKDSNSSASPATKEFDQFLDYLRVKKISLTDSDCPQTLIDQFIKLKKAKELETKKLVDYADQLKSTNMNIDETIVDLIKSNASNTQEKRQFNTLIAANMALLEKTTQENLKLKEQLKEESNRKRLPEYDNEPPKKKLKTDHVTDQNDSKLSTFIPYGDKGNLTHTKRADLFLSQLLNPHGYFQKFATESTSYNESIINGAHHNGSVPNASIHFGGGSNENVGK